MASHKNLAALYIVLLLISPLALFLKKHEKRFVIQRIVATLYWFKLINLGKLSFAQLEAFGIDDIHNGQIIWSKGR